MRKFKSRRPPLWPPNRDERTQEDYPTSAAFTLWSHKLFSFNWSMWLAITSTFAGVPAWQHSILTKLSQRFTLSSISLSLRLTSTTRKTMVSWRRNLAMTSEWLGIYSSCPAKSKIKTWPKCLLSNSCVTMPAVCPSQGRRKLDRTGAAIQRDLSGCVRTFKLLPQKKRGREIPRGFYDGHCCTY